MVNLRFAWYSLDEPTCALDLLWPCFSSCIAAARAPHCCCCTCDADVHTLVGCVLPLALTQPHGYLSHSPWLLDRLLSELLSEAGRENKVPYLRPGGPHGSCSSRLLIAPVNLRIAPESSCHSVDCSCQPLIDPVNLLIALSTSSLLLSTS